MNPTINNSQVKMPAVISSDLARKQFDTNIQRLQKFEIQFENSKNTIPINGQEEPKPKTT